MTRKRKTEARKKRKLKELDKAQELKKTSMNKLSGGADIEINGVNFLTKLPLWHK